MEKGLIQKIKLSVLGTVAAAVIAASFMIPFEGIKFKSYRDSVGIWTICRGHTLNVTENQIADKKQCDEWFQQDVDIAENAFNKLVNNPHEVPVNVKAAALSFIFNAGAQNFAKSTMRKKINRRDFKGACNEFPKWKFAKGRDCTVRSNNCYGLIIRRQKEKELCLEPHDFDYFDFNGDNFITGVRSAQSLNQ